MIEKRPFLDGITHFVLLIGVFFIVFPVWMALVASTHGPESLTLRPLPIWFGEHGWKNYREILFAGLPESGGIPVGLMMLNSLIMALGITVGKLIMSILAAFAVVYFRFPLRMMFFWLIFITLMLPVEIRILPTFDVVTQLGMLNSYAGLCVPLMASATATFLFRQFFMTIPAELVEASKMDSAGAMRFLFDILLPLSRTNIAALFIILFIFGWNQYLWPLMITTDESYTTIIMGIRRMVNSGEALPTWHYIMGMAILGLLPPVIIVLAMQRLFVKGLLEREK